MVVTGLLGALVRTAVLGPAAGAGGFVSSNSGRRCRSSLLNLGWNTYVWIQGQLPKVQTMMRPRTGGTLIFTTSCVYDLS